MEMIAKPLEGEPMRVGEKCLAAHGSDAGKHSR